jgi:V8-like Glu-specific endopeptidase
MLVVRTRMFCVAVVGVLGMSQISFSETKVIYGEDDRKEVYDTTNSSLMVEASKSTAILVRTRDLVQDTAEFAVVNSETFEDGAGVCKEEPFSEQINPGFCSGFLVGPDLVATAGHCIRSQSVCDGTTFIFGFGYNSAPTAETDLSKVLASNVYRCKKVVKQVLENSSLGADFAVLKLDRVVTDRAPLKVRRSGTTEVGTKITVIGHPSGLPTKISGGASVRSNDESDAYFVANLDTYGGNSGSAVLNSETGEVEGILVRGETDFNYDNAKRCYLSNRCKDNDCRGEDVSKASTFQAFIP